MGLFDIFKRKEPQKSNEESKVLLAMPMFNSGDRYSLKEISHSLQNFWNLTISEIEGDDNTAILIVEGERVAIAYMPVPIPFGDIEGAAQYAYNWQNAIQDLKEHNGHAIVSIMSGQKRTVDRFRLLSKVLCSVLSTSNAVGIYQGNQSLLIPKDQYLENSEELKKDGTPVPIWVYLGLRQSDRGNSIYTYGMTAFGKQEMEVINSKLSLEELYNFLANICSYVIANDITFNSGETLGYTAGQKIKIISSKGQFVDGYSLKLEL